MNLYGRMNILKEVKILDNSNILIGNLLSEKHNKFILNLDLYDNRNLHIDFYNNFQECKLYLDDDDKIFFIKKKDGSYFIYLFSKFIGKINVDTTGRIKKNKYKVIVYDEYKIYLNLFGIGFILMMNID